MPSLGANPAPGAPMPEHSHRDRPTSSQPPLLPHAATAASSAAASEDLNARAPVQETLPKELLEQESPHPPGSVAYDRASDGLRREGQVLHSADAARVTVGPPVATNTAMPPAGTFEQGRDWPSRQQHPVCVDNGYFGNANHLNRSASGLGPGRSLLSRDPRAARSLDQPRNEPEEVHYVSAELPTRSVEAVRVRELPPQTQAPCGSGYGEPPGSFVDVRNPLLIQKQFDAEQKRVGMLRDHEGDGDAQMETTPLVSAPARTDTSTSSSASLKPPVQEEKLPAGERASSALSVLTKEKVLPASAAPLLGATFAGSFEGTAGRRTPPVSSPGNIRVFHSEVEEDMELSKPGILLSVVGESPQAAGCFLGSRGPSNPYSGDSNRLEISSDPLMVSTDSSSPGKVLPGASLGRSSPAPAAHAEPRGGEATGASSHLPLSWDSTSQGTHEVRVDRYPSVLLGAAQDLPERDGPFRNPPAFDSSTNSSLSQAKVSPRDSNGSSLSYLAPAAGIALISAVAFLVYARLQK
nr:PREDICTED: uncharacterized protein LOC104148594 [Struthio camelus australis]